MKNYSIWLDNIDFKKTKPVDEDMNVDVIIIGGGITGLSTLYALKDSGLKTILVERETCAMGVTSKSTAKITYLQGDNYMNIRAYDKEKAKKYLESQIKAVNLLKDIIIKEDIHCDLEKSSSYTFTKEEQNIEKIEEEYSFLKSCKIDAELLSDVPFEENVLKAVKIDDAYVFHPVKYLNHIKNLMKENIFEDSKVTDIKHVDDSYLCEINGKIITAKKVVIATHYPYFLIPFFLPLKSYIEVSYVGAKVCDKYNSCNALNIDKTTISLRYHHDSNKNYFINLYKSYKTCNVNNIKENFVDLQERDEFDYIWSNNDIMTNDYLPFIGRLKKHDNTMFIATGFNTWGMTNGTLSGFILADLIQNKKNVYEKLFDPNRDFNLSKIVRFPLDLTSNIKSFIKSGKKNINNSRVTYTKIGDTAVAIYVDDEGKKHTVLDRCPHVKCGIIFNEVEKTWDCLCHGSRFDLDGNVIEGQRIAT